MLPQMRSINLPVVNDRTDPAQRERLAASLPEAYAAVLRDAKPDTAIAERVAAYATLTAPKAERPVGTIAGSFTRSGKADSAGGIRANLECVAPPCMVAFGQAFTMQPFGNSLVVMTLTGDQLKDMLESQQRSATGEPTWLQPSEGFSYTWQSDAPRGARVRDMQLLAEAIRPESSYRVTVNSFLAEGGDGFASLKDGAARSGGGQDIDALIAYLGAAERAPTPEPRIKRLP